MNGYGKRLENLFQFRSLFSTKTSNNNTVECEDLESQYRSVKKRRSLFGHQDLLRRESLTQKRIVGASKTYRVLVLGSVGVGKTSILRRFINDEFFDEHMPTVSDVYETGIFVEQESTMQQVDLELRDFSGELRNEYPELYHDEMAKADAFILVYADNKTHASVVDYYSDIEHSRVSVPIIVARNKTDLNEPTRRTSQYFSMKNVKQVQLSAKENANVEETVRRMGIMIANG